MSVVQRLETPADPPDVKEQSVHPAWVDKIMQRERDALLGMLWRILGNEEDALDAFQDTFCKMAFRANETKIVNRKGYIYRTATNLAIEMIRARRRHQDHLPSLAARQVALLVDAKKDWDGEDRNELREAIPELPAHLRQVVILRDMGRLPYKEIGKLLNISPATARVYRRHAIVELAENLKTGESS